MRGPARPLADGGAPPTSLFESFPDPMLTYASRDRTDGTDGPDESAGGTAASGRTLVVGRVNAAFEATFDVAGGEVAGTPLDELVLAGSALPGRVPADAAAGTRDPDPDSDPDGDAATDASATDTGDAGTAERAENVGEADGPDAADPEPAPTAGSVLDRARESGTAVRLEHGVEGRTRHFRVRAVPAGAGAPADGRGVLLFTDVTDLERDRRDLAETVARLERISSVASHDLRNPLEVARIRLEAARDTGEAVHFEKVTGALDRIEHIARDVLGTGSGGVDPTDAVALEAAAEAAWETVDTAGATLVTAPELPTVRADADRLRGLFENLLRNAIEHGGRDVTVTVEPLPDGFAVADDGPGLPEAVRERAFEAGYSTASGNTGLGLSIVRRIARGHGWRVAIVPGRTGTDADVGARFEFTGVERVGGGDDASAPDGSGR